MLMVLTSLTKCPWSSLGKVYRSAFRCMQLGDNFCWKIDLYTIHCALVNCKRNKDQFSVAFSFVSQ